MRSILLLLMPALLLAQSVKEDPKPRLSDEDKIELLRGLSAEYATVKAFVPRSKKALKFNSDGTWDKADWSEIGREYGPVARTGDLVQITRVNFDGDQIVLTINGGFNQRGKWYERIEVGAGVSTVPTSRNVTRTAGTTIALKFPDRVPPLKPEDVKRMLKPVLDFEKHSATDDYFASLPPEIQAAIKAKRAEIGMTRDQVIMALGQPRDKIRESSNGDETEDWIYGQPPGKISFITFANNKVSKIKDTYAGLGGSIAPMPKGPQ